MIRALEQIIEWRGKPGVEELRSDDVGFMRVPQTPMTAVAACASSLIALADIAPQLLSMNSGSKSRSWSCSPAALVAMNKVGWNRGCALESKSKGDSLAANEDKVLTL